MCRADQSSDFSDADRTKEQIRIHEEIPINQHALISAGFLSQSSHDLQLANESPVLMLHFLRKQFPP